MTHGYYYTALLEWVENPITATECILEYIVTTNSTSRVSLFEKNFTNVKSSINLRTLNRALRCFLSENGLHGCTKTA